MGSEDGLHCGRWVWVAADHVARAEMHVIWMAIINSPLA